jgi:hypothetical protein
MGLFKSKDGVMVTAHNIFEEKILRENPNYTEIKKEVEVVKTKSTRKGGNKPS